MSEVISADQVVGRDLFAVKAGIKIKRNPSSDAETLRTLSRGDRVGNVYSFVERTGEIWWMLKPDATEYVLHEKGAFDLDALKQQGAMTNEDIERAKALENASFFEKLMLEAKYKVSDALEISWVRTALVVVILALVFLVLFKVGKSTGFNSKVSSFVKQSIKKQ